MSHLFLVLQSVVFVVIAYIKLSGSNHSRHLDLRVSPSRERAYNVKWWSNQKHGMYGYTYLFLKECKGDFLRIVSGDSMDFNCGHVHLF